MRVSEGGWTRAAAVALVHWELEELPKLVAGATDAELEVALDLLLSAKRVLLMSSRDRRPQILDETRESG